MYKHNYFGGSSLMDARRSLLIPMMKIAMIKICVGLNK